MKQLEIRTTQHVTIEYDLATLGSRVTAFVLDVILVYLFLQILYTLLETFFGKALSNSSWSMYFLYGILPVFLLLGQQTFLESRNNGQTIGKRMLGIRVLRLDGQEAGGAEYLLRSLFLLVDVIFSAGTLASFLVATSPRAQRLGDIATQMVVVQTRSNARFSLDDILKIQSVENYEPRYPAVRKLSEKDVLLIKTTLGRFQRFNNAAHAENVYLLAAHLGHILDIKSRPKDSIEFLKILLRDYIVLTR